MRVNFVPLDAPVSLWTNVRLKLRAKRTTRGASAPDNAPAPPSFVCRVPPRRPPPMPLRTSLSRSLLIATVVAGFAASGGSALANPSDNGLDQRSAGAPGAAEYSNGSGDQTNNGKADDHRPAGTGGGRKVG